MALIRTGGGAKPIQFNSFARETLSALSSTGYTTATIGHKYTIFGYNAGAGAVTGVAISGCTLDKTLEVSESTREFVITATNTTFKFNITGGNITYVFITDISQ